MLTPAGLAICTLIAVIIGSGGFVIGMQAGYELYSRKRSDDAAAWLDSGPGPAPLTQRRFWHLNPWHLPRNLLTWIEPPHEITEPLRAPAYLDGMRTCPPADPHAADEYELRGLAAAAEAILGRITDENRRKGRAMVLPRCPHDRGRNDLFPRPGRHTIGARTPSTAKDQQQ